MKKFLVTLAFANCCCHWAMADVELSASVDLYNNYVWRGVSQTLNDPSLQIGTSLGHDSGFYGGVWFSNVDYGTKASTEADYYLGYSTTFAYDLWQWDVLYTEFDYPEQGSFNFSELSTTFSHQGWSLMLAFSNDFSSGAGYKNQSTKAIELSKHWTVMEHYSLDVAAGYYDLGDAIYYEKSSYSYYNAVISRDINQRLSWSLGLHDTSVTDIECWQTSLCGSHFVVGLHAAF